MTTTTESRPAAQGASDAVLAAALMLPWLWPFASGPSSSVAPWLAGAACMTLLALAFGCGIHRVLVGAAAFFVPLAAWRAVSPLEPAALGGALVLVGIAAGVGAKLARDGDAIVIARAWWIVAAISTAFALLQYFGWAAPFAPWISPTEPGTAYANLRQRNQFASLTAIGLAALLWEARRGTPTRWLVVLAAWLGVGNAASVSRTGLLEFVVLVALALLWPGRSRRQAQVAFSALAAYGVGIALLPQLLAAVTGLSPESLWQRVSNPDSCAGRKVLWSNVLHLIGERPWAGWGWGELDFGHYMTLYPGSRFCDILDNAHSLPLHLAVEFGLPVAIVSLALVAWAVVRERPWAEGDSLRQLAWAVLAVIAIHSLLEYPLWYAPFQIACGLALGLLWPGREDAAAGAGLRRAAGGVLAVLVAYATWDYARITQVYLPAEERVSAWRDDPLERASASWLFREHALFARLTLTPLTRANARWTFDLAKRMLHYSPEPRVIEKLVESALLTGRDDVVREQLPRYRAAFPKDEALWLREHADPRVLRD